MSETEVKIAHRQINCAMVVHSAGDTYRVPCILDTGAMQCCINDALCRQMKRKKIGVTRVGGANGSAEVPVYEALVGIPGLNDFVERVEIIGLSTRTALLGYELFSKLDAIDINLKTDSVTFHAGGESVAH